MAKRLGLDIGTNSIGWCLMEDSRIIDLGVRIFPVGVKEDDYNKSGSEISKNAGRRMARGIRRLYDRYKLRRKQLRKLLLDLNMLPDETMVFTAKELYGLRKKALDEKISLKEIGRIFLLLNQRRGFKSSKKDAKSTEGARERSEMKLRMNELTGKVADGGFRTVGEYFFSLFNTEGIENWRNENEPIERIRSRFVYRKLYEEEFDAIWSVQKKYYPTEFSDLNKKRIKDDCIFYQRPLKSQKHLVGHCRFEPRKRVSPRSSLAFQEFRIWQLISNLRLTNEERFRDKLTIDEKKILAEALNKTKELTQTAIKDLLRLGRKTQFNELPEKIKGNTTYSKLAEALGENYLYDLKEDQKEHLWHVLFFANDEEWLLNYAKSKLGMTDEQANNFAEIDLEPDYSNISAKALRPILAFMKEGHDYIDACTHVGYHHSFDEETDSKDRELKEKIQREKGDELRNPLVQQAVSETIRLVNAVLAEHGKPDEMRVEFARSLKKPKEVREKMKRNNDDKERRREMYVEFLKSKVNEIGLSRISKADILKFELWLEMEFAHTDLLKIKSDIKIDDFKKFARNVKASDKEKYQLWLECGRISPYTGKIINLNELFSPEIEIEHIIPYSKCMDDSFTNKTLSEKTFNEKKGNQTPYHYFEGTPHEWKAFKERIKSFSDGKQERFMMQEVPSDFLNSQLNNTAYIAKEVRKKLKTVCKNVRITNGQATSILRRFWGLNDLLNPEGKNEKSRHDHRHHAIDALVIANTTDYYINLLSQQSQFDFTGRMILREVPSPYSSFRLEAAEKLNTLLISYRNKKRLITKKRNKYIHSGKEIKPQLTTEIRGALHEETFYGQIKNPHTGDLDYVVRKPLSMLETMKQVNKIVDPSIRKIVIEHIEANGGENNIKKAMAIPVVMFSKDGKKEIPVRKVRMIDSAESMVQLRPNENKKLFVSPGSNFLIGIYEDGDRKRDYETVSFLDAVKRAMDNLPVILATKEDKKLFFTLKQKDMVVIYENHADEIDWKNQRELFNKLYRVIKFNANGQISLGIHQLTNINPDRPKLYEKGTVINCSASTIKAVKARVTITGKIIPMHDQTHTILRKPSLPFTVQQTIGSETPTS